MEILIRILGDMKKHIHSIINFVALVAASFLLGACHDDSVPEQTKMRVQTQIIDLSKEDGATIRSIISGDVPVSNVDYLEFKYYKNESMGSSSQSIVLRNLSDTMVFNLPVEAGETYFFQYKLVNEVSSYATKPVMFTINKDFQINNFWMESSDLREMKCSGSVAFSIGKKGYVGLGKKGNGDKTLNFWQYDSETKEWSQMTDYPYTEGIDMATSFVLDGKGYVFLGMGESFYNVTCCSYDPETNEWTRLSRFPGYGRTGTTTFLVGKKAYIVGGYADKFGNIDEVWCYDVETDSWKQKNDFIGGKLTGMYSFKIGNTIYVGGGFNEKNEFNSTLYSYDPVADSWSVVSTGTPKVAYAVAFSGENSAYLAGGIYRETDLYGSPDQFFRFDGTNWTGLGLTGSDIRAKACGFRIDDVLYVGMGENSEFECQSSVLSYIVSE